MNRTLFGICRHGLAGLAVFGIFFALPVSAQETAEGEEEQETEVTPTMRLQVSDRFSKAEVCLEEEDIECALEHLDYVERIRDLSDYERGQLLNFRAFMAFELDDIDGAIAAYEELLQLPREELPKGLIQSSMRNLATLYLQEDDMQKGLDTFIEWMELPYVSPLSQDYYLLGSIHYQMEQYAEGIAPVTQAIELANSKGELGEEAWYTLLYVLHYQVEQFDEVIEVLSILVENWPKWDHARQLAGQLSERGREHDVLTIMESAHGLGWLEQSSELVQLANLYLATNAPYKASVLLQEGLDNGDIESTEQNWRLLAQAWQLAAEHESALPALQRASSLAEDGSVDQRLAQSYARLARWEECIDSSRDALDRGGLDRPDYVNMQLGQCLVNMRQYSEARAAFQEASEDDRSRDDARRWLAFVGTEMERERTNAELLAILAAQAEAAQ